MENSIIVTSETSKEILDNIKLGDMITNNGNTGKVVRILKLPTNWYFLFQVSESHFEKCTINQDLIK